MFPVMRSFHCLAVLLTLSYCTSVQGSVRVDSMTVAPFGKVHVYVPDGPPTSVTIMISGDAGWKYGVLDFAKHFAERNSLVIGVDILRYYTDLRKRDGDCLHIATDFVALATEAERQYGIPEYKEPLVMGYSSGATMVYALLCQSRPGTFQGGISLGFCPDVELPKAFCESNGLKLHPLVNRKSFDLDPDSKLSEPWVVLQGKLDQICNYKNTADFIAGCTDAVLVPLEHVGHGFGKWSDFMPQWEQAFDKMTKPLTGNTNNATAPQVDTDLPLIITPAKTPDPLAPLVFFISGDGGWYSFEGNMSDRMAENGTPTVGLDAKKYFWDRKTPEETTAAVEKTCKAYMARFNKQTLVLMGYSMGAEVLPFIFANLSSEMKTAVKGSVLLSPGEMADFEVHITNMLGIGNSSNTYDVVKELRQIAPSTSILIITGEKEDSTLPKELAATGIKFAQVPGDHHYDNDPGSIVRVLKAQGLVP